MADFEPFFELKNHYRESCPVLLQSGALYREESTVSAEAEEIETAEATLPAEQEEAASPRTFLRLAFRNIDPRAVTSVYVDIHIFDKATNELAVVRDRRYLVPILGRDAVFGADEEIDVDDAAYSFSVAIKKVQFEGEDVFWNGSASLLFENLPEQAKIADVMEDEDLRAQYQRDFTEMAEDKEAAAQFAPQEYKDLWMCACGEVNHKDEEKCAACGAEYGPQHALLEDEEKLKENLEAYNKAEAEKAEAARIAAEKKAAEEKAAAEAAARKAAEEKAAAEEAARKKRLHRKIFLSISIPLAVLIAAFVVVLIVYIIPQNHYNDAAALLEAGKYDEAITAFTALAGYSDSAARITEAEYKKACDLLENEKFAEAIEAFTALGDYEDSKDRITEAEYRRAVKTFESGAYEDALNLLEPLKDYKDAAEKIETCHYELGMKALEADNLKSAAAHFKEVNAEQNKKMQAAFCDKGIAFYEKGDEEKALTYFEYVTDKDLLPKIDDAYYAQALKLVEDGEYDKATVTAVTFFQRGHELEETGEADEETRARMNASDALSYEVARSRYFERKEAQKNEDKLNRLCERAIACVGSVYEAGKAGPTSYGNAGMVYACFKEIDITLEPTISLQLEYAKKQKGWNESVRQVKVGQQVFLKKGQTVLTGIYVGDSVFIYASPVEEKVIAVRSVMSTGKYEFIGSISYF